MKTITRLKEFIDYKQVSLNAFDKLIGAANGYIGKAIKNNASIGTDVIEKIISIYPDLNPGWLLTGEGGMLKNYAITPGVSNLVNEPQSPYGSIPPAKNGQKTEISVSPTVSPTANFEAKEVYLYPKIITVDNEAKENILYVPLKASAGYLKGTGDIEYMEKLPSFRLPGLTDATYRAFEVDGDSMYPTLEHGEMVIGKWVEKLDHIREDRVHIIVTKSEGVLVKRLLNRIDKYGYIIAKSDSVNNRNLYPNKEIHPDDILEVWYAVWHGGVNFMSPGDLWNRQNNLEADMTDILRRLKEAGI